jgi:hypothetical protein
MPALVAGIHILQRSGCEDVDARNKSGHDDSTGLERKRAIGDKLKAIRPRAA